MENSVAIKEHVLFKVHQVFKKCLPQEGFIKYDVKIKDISTNGGNYLSNLYEAQVIGETEQGEKVIHIFIKKIITGGNLTLWPIAAVHERELFFYNELIHKYNALQAEVSIPDNEKYKAAKSFSDDAQLLMLENYQAKGYKQKYDRLDTITLDYAEMCIKRIAKFHALSFALEIKDSDYFKDNIKTKKNTYTITEEKGYVEWRKFLDKVSQSTLNILDDKAKAKLIKFIPKMTDKLKKYSIDTDNFKCCMIHGDYKPNNILTLETNGRLSDIMPLDFQMLQYASPLNDFFFYIFISTDQKFRRKHLEYLKNTYYDTMANFLKYFKVNIQEIYSKTVFEKEYKERLDFGLIMFMVLAPFLFAPNDDIPSFEQDLLSNNFTIVEEAKGRVVGVVEDFIDWGYL